MAMTERMWQRLALSIQFDFSPNADMLASLLSAHAAQERLAPSIGSNVPDNTPRPFTTGPILETGLGTILRARA